jgi:hypothetical protein
VFQGAIIDTDHWRHFYLLLGLVWGCIGLEYRYQRQFRRTAGAHAAQLTAPAHRPPTANRSLLNLG